MQRLDGRVALVTGGARGIGAATAETLANAGASVLVTDVLEAEGAETERRLTKAGHKVVFRRQDVSSEASWADVLAFCESRFGGLDILVNNAGVLLVKPLLDTTLADFRRVQSINVEGTFLGIRAAIPLIGARAGQWPGGGAIVNLSSVAGLVGSPSAIAYCASKGAIRLMSKSAALECAALGLKIRVNSIHPGRTRTMMYDEAMKGLRAAGNAHDDSSAEGEAQDIANAILFAASDAAAFMTGSEIVVDGGFSAR